MSLLIGLNAHSQSKLETLKFENRTIYIFSRGTKTKSGIIAEKFNIQDKKITHVGIGFLEKDKLMIYNVVDVDTVKTALIVDDLNSFLSPDVFYLSVWKCKTKYGDFAKLKKICRAYQSQKIYFDFSFKLNDGNTMYCSEFCSKVLRETNPIQLNFEPKLIKLDSFYSIALDRKDLLYYPVDFFEENNRFVKIFETDLPVVSK